MFLILNRAVFFLFILNFYTFVAAGDDLKDDNVDNKRSDSGGVWFGPRLGKRTTNFALEDNRTPFLRLLEAADALKYYYDQLQYDSYDMQADDPGMKMSKKIIFTPKLGRSLSNDKRYEIDFRPRLGRRRTNDIPAIPFDQDPRGLPKDNKRYESVWFTPRVGKRLSRDDQDSNRVDADQMDRRVKYFSPRLGRTMNFSPRLGRDLTYELYPDKVRVARSANKTKPT